MANEVIGLYQRERDGIKFILYVDEHGVEKLAHETGIWEKTESRIAQLKEIEYDEQKVEKIKDSLKRYYKFMKW